MSIPASPSTPPSPGNDRSHAANDPIDPGFEERMRLYWERNSGLILAVCAAVLLVIVGKGLWDVLAERREEGVAAEYAKAADTTQLGAFAEAHEDHALAGIAHLRMADEAYAESRFADAAASYEQASEILDEAPWSGRIALGLAMSRLQSGQVAEGEQALRELAEDEAQLSAIRAEAAYHLARRASETGRTEEVNSLATLIMTIDPTSSWSQRAFMLRSEVEPVAPAAMAPAPATAPAAEEAPAVQFKVGE